MTTSRRVSWIEMWWSEPAPATRKRSQNWCTRSVTRSWASPGGSSEIPRLAEDVLQNALVTDLAEAPASARGRPLRGMGLPDPGPRLLRGRAAQPRWASTIRVLHTDVASDVDDIQKISDRDELEQAFRRLPLDQRAVFVLHHHVGLPLVAVAETLGIPDGTARSRLHYATRALRAAFEPARASTQNSERGDWHEQQP